MPAAVSNPTSAAGAHARRFMSLRRWLGGVVVASQVSSCASSPATETPTTASSVSSNSALVRYRLPLRNNPVDAGRALHCYVDCQARISAEDYMSCLEACPGFETTLGVACGPEEVPPIAVCFTGRRVPAASEPEPGTLVIGVVGGFAVVVELASVCASSNSQCAAVVP